MAKKVLIVYYSRTGISETLAKLLQKKLNCDIDKVDYASREKVAYGAAAIEAVRKTVINIKGDNCKAEEYDKIIFISPVWGQALATPIRSYMAANKAKIKEYDLIATCKGAGLSGAVKDAIATIGKSPVITEKYLSAQIEKGDVSLQKFLL